MENQDTEVIESPIRPEKEMQRIRRSIELQKPRKEDAAKFWRAYCGDYSIKGRKNLDDAKDEVFLNFVFSYVESSMASLFSGDPRVSVEEKNPESAASSASMEATINYWLKELNGKKHISRCLFDSHFGIAAASTEWDYEEIMQDVPEIDPLTGQPTGEMVQEPKVVKDQPKLRWINAWNVILDPDSESPEFDRWRAERLLVTMEQLKLMDGIDPAVLEKIKPGQLPRDISRQPFEYENKIGVENEWVILYKIYDVENNQIRLLCDNENIREYLYIKPWPYDFEVAGDRFPITILEARPSMESNYGFSDFRASWTQIQERNRVRTTLQAHARRIRPAWLAKKGMNDEADLDRFAEARIDEVIQMKAPEGIITRPYPEIPLDLYKYDDIARDDLQNTMAFWDSQNDSIANTATEASLMASKGNLRSGRKREALEDFVATIGAKIGALCQQFMTKEIAIKIRHPQNPKELTWLGVSRDMIQGEFDYSVKPGVMQQHNEGLRRQQTLKFGELMANNKYVNQRWLAEQLTKTFEFDPQEALRSEEEVQAEAASQLPEKPPLQFDKIDPAALAPEAQNAVVQAAFKQNGIQEVTTPPAPIPMGAAQGQGGPLPPLTDVNQAPADMPMGEPPPANPIMPISEMQGGPQ